MSGKPVGIQQRSTGKAEINEITVQSEAVSFLSTWKPATERQPSMEPILEVATPPKHIHHFCTVTNEYQLPEQFRHLGRKYHAPDKFLAPKQPFRVRDYIATVIFLMSHICKCKFISDVKFLDYIFIFYLFKNTLVAPYFINMNTMV